MKPGDVWRWVRAACLGGAMLVALLPANAAAQKREGRTVKVTINQADLKENPEQLTKNVAKGDQLEVRLEYKATGYLWRLTKDDPSKLKREGEPKTEREANEPGAPEYKVFRFDVLDKGELEFQLARPFGNAKPKVLHLKIAVEGQAE